MLTILGPIHILLSSTCCCESRWRPQSLPRQHSSARFHQPFSLAEHTRYQLKTLALSTHINVASLSKTTTEVSQNLNASQSQVPPITMEASQHDNSATLRLLSQLKPATNALILLVTLFLLYNVAVYVVCCTHGKRPTTYKTISFPQLLWRRTTDLSLTLADHLFHVG